MNHTTLTCGVDPKRPLIYMWETRDAAGQLTGLYFGESENGDARPRTHYANNVRKLREGRPYRKSKPDKFRKVHRGLLASERRGDSITLTYLCNAEPHELEGWENQLIAQFDSFGTEPWQLNDKL